MKPEARDPRGVKDLRGVAVIPGDIVAVGVTRGSSGGWLSVRRVVDVKGNRVTMQNPKTHYDGTVSEGKTFQYTAASDFLILPSSYADALAITD